jgi:hypothetical protein
MLTESPLVTADQRFKALRQTDYVPYLVWVSALL